MLLAAHEHRLGREGHCEGAPACSGLMAPKTRARGCLGRRPAHHSKTGIWMNKEGSCLSWSALGEAATSACKGFAVNPSRLQRWCPPSWPPAPCGSVPVRSPWQSSTPSSSQPPQSSLPSLPPPAGASPPQPQHSSLWLGSAERTPRPSPGCRRGRTVCGDGRSGTGPPPPPFPHGAALRPSKPPRGRRDLPELSPRAGRGRAAPARRRVPQRPALRRCAAATSRAAARAASPPAFLPHRRRQRLPRLPPCPADRPRAGARS